MNVRLLREIQKAVLEDPARLDMNVGLCTAKYYREKFKDDGPRCGTVGCIAGHAVALAGTPNIPTQGIRAWHCYDGIEQEALHLLDLERAQGNRLFHSVKWPEKYQDALNCATYGTAEYAQVTSDRIDHFIATGE